MTNTTTRSSSSSSSSPQSAALVPSMPHAICRSVPVKGVCPRRPSASPGGLPRALGRSRNARRCLSRELWAIVRLPTHASIGQARPAPPAASLARAAACRAATRARAAPSSPSPPPRARCRARRAASRSRRRRAARHRQRASGIRCFACLISVDGAAAVAGSKIIR